jgi:hypothetical protein
MTEAVAALRGLFRGEAVATDVVTKLSLAIIDAQPSALKFSPLRHDLFVVSTYTLQDAPSAAPVVGADGLVDLDFADPSYGQSGGRAQKRAGSLILFRLEDGKV